MCCIYTITQQQKRLLTILLHLRRFRLDLVTHVLVPTLEAVTQRPHFKTVFAETFIFKALHIFVATDQNKRGNALDTFY